MPEILDSYKLIISHDPQEETVSTGQKDEEHQCATASERDGYSPQGQEVDQNNSRRVKDLQNSQIGQKEIHGSVEWTLCPDIKKDCGITNETAIIH